ncbi:MAG TPA: ABC transporter permease [Methylomirabilota bacterium]|jgi:putative spermidine/putrescine transport system permease protein|nr:ABC transporter permease [Methylomirabilota bacterium]HEV8673493.1 ABC transporter permease [Methylomirabilota bacterium]
MAVRPGLDVMARDVAGADWEAIRHRWFRRGLGLLTAVVYLGILAPILVVVLASVSPTEVFTFPPPGVTLKWYQEFFRDSNMRDGFWLSFVVAAGSAVISLVLGTAAALGLTRERFALRHLVSAFFLSPIIFPSLITGVALLLFFRALGVPTLPGLILGHAIISVPYVIRTVAASLAGFDVTIEEAARIHGASPLRAFVRVTLPIIQPGIMAGAVFAFIVSFSELNVSLFLSGPGAATLPIHIFSQIQFGAGQVVIAAASTLQIVLIVGLMVVVEKLFGISVAPQS